MRGFFITQSKSGSNRYSSKNETGMAGANQHTQGHDYMLVITNNLNNY